MDFKKLPYQVILEILRRFYILEFNDINLKKLKDEGSVKLFFGKFKFDKLGKSFQLFYNFKVSTKCGTFLRSEFKKKKLFLFPRKIKMLEIHLFRDDLPSDMFELIHSYSDSIVGVEKMHFSDFSDRFCDFWNGSILYEKFKCYEQGIELLKRGIDFDSSDSEFVVKLFFRLCEIHYSNNFKPTALNLYINEILKTKLISEKILSKLLELSEYSYVLFFESWTLKEVEEYDKSINKAELSIKCFENNFLSLFLLGSVYNIIGDFKKALEILEKGIIVCEGFVSGENKSLFGFMSRKNAKYALFPYYTEMIISLVNLKNFERSIRICLERLKKEPSSVGLYIALSMISIIQDDVGFGRKKMEELLDRVKVENFSSKTEHDESVCILHNCLFLLKIEQKEYENALKDILFCLNVKPNEEIYQFNHALCLYFLKGYKFAIESIEELGRKKKPSFYYRIKGIVLGEEKRFDEGIKYLKVAEKMYNSQLNKWMIKKQIEELCEKKNKNCTICK